MSPVAGNAVGGVACSPLVGVTIAGERGCHDIILADGMVADIVASERRGGGFVTSLLADVHVHLDKTHTIGRINAGNNKPVLGLFDAIALMEQDRSQWDEPDVRARAGAALAEAYANGVGAMRTHVDWTTPDVPKAWPILNRLKEEWRGRMDLQIASLVRGDMVPQIAPSVAARVRADGGVFGAFFYRNADLAAKIETMFNLAREHDLDLDFHVDEGLDDDADGLSLIIDATRRHGWAHRVLCGHVCSLARRSDEELQQILGAAAQAGVAIVSLPRLNLYLQDRAAGRSPRLRGVAPLKEARAAGVKAMLATDNVRDPFYPYGDYDPLSILRLAVPVCHLEPAEWLESITSLPASWMESQMVTPLRKGGAANFIWHDAASADELVSRPTAGRVVYRQGQPVTTTELRLPGFGEARWKERCGVTASGA